MNRMNRFVPSLVAIGLLFAGCHSPPPSVDASMATDELTQLPGKSTGVEMISQWICAGSDIPDGWIKIDDRWDPHACGNPSNMSLNLWLIEKYADKPIGATMEVAVNAPTPEGWAVVATRWDPTGCGHPTQMVHNVKIIERVED